MTVKQGVKENVQHHSNNANILDVLNQFKFSLKLIFFWKKTIRFMSLFNLC